MRNLSANHTVRQRPRDVIFAGGSAKHEDSSRLFVLNLRSSLKEGGNEVNDSEQMDRRSITSVGERESTPGQPPGKLKLYRDNSAKVVLWEGVRSDTGSSGKAGSVDDDGQKTSGDGTDDRDGDDPAVDGERHCESSVLRTSSPVT